MANYAAKNETHRQVKMVAASLNVSVKSIVDQAVKAYLQNITRSLRRFGQRSRTR